MAGPSEKRSARDEAAIKVAVHFNDSDLLTFRREAHKALAGQVTFHWPLEFPEVMVERGGFDGFVGNPPFMGAKKMASAIGPNYRDHIVTAVANGVVGNADLCAYFILRFVILLCNMGSFGCIATNTISQGDTKDVGLETVAAAGSALFRAISSQKWPGSANLEVSLLWAYRGDWRGQAILNDLPVERISASLSDSGDTSCNRLGENSGQSFIGSVISGIGFVLSPAEAANLIRITPVNLPTFGRQRNA